jgi:hypothetical protein
MPEPTQIKVIREFDGRHHSSAVVTRKLLEEGWLFLSVRVERPPRDEDDGSFKDYFVYLLGTTDEIA